jgi:hypothetical protein
MTGVFIVSKRASIGACIADLLLIAQCSEDDEWEGKTEYLPWR